MSLGHPPSSAKRPALLAQPRAAAAPVGQLQHLHSIAGYNPRRPRRLPVAWCTPPPPPLAAASAVPPAPTAPSCPCCAAGRPRSRHGRQRQQGGRCRAAAQPENGQAGDQAAGQIRAGVGRRAQVRALAAYHNLQSVGGLSLGWQAASCVAAPCHSTPLAASTTAVLCTAASCTRCWVPSHECAHAMSVAALPCACRPDGLVDAGWATCRGKRPLNEDTW